MANPGFPPGSIDEAARLVAEHGSVAAASRASGIPDATLRRRYSAAQVDPAIRNSMDAIGTKMVPALAWTKTKAGPDGTSYSVLLKPDTSTTSEDALERIRAAFDGIKPAEPVIPPESVMTDLCNVFPLFDVHFGMRAWGQETRGPDYDVDLAVSDLKEAFESVLALTPFAERGVLIIGGDFFHADDSRNETPAHKHNLDVDGRYQKIVDDAIEVLGYVIGRIQSRHRHTTICVLRGNHDEHSHVVLQTGLRQRYRNDGTVAVETSLDGLYMTQWGRAAIFAHHGDKAPPERQALYLSDVCPFWSNTRHRHYYTGHVHKEQSRDLGPVKWESLRAFCPPDAYASSMGYASRRQIYADTYHSKKGRVLRATDPIERASE